MEIRRCDKPQADRWGGIFWSGLVDWDNANDHAIIFLGQPQP